ncbi:hypothetical protein OG302_42850 [Streptomyces sp. NBC_01283]|uniref:hypothetical protein n=1 Tax=Streptomyces sp. NBC_01283 TaxID=2903812 RepID=UPI00352D0A82|nr:hypothetical protein OG302_42850 [Streptomyces sp. NBC_01283]
MHHPLPSARRGSYKRHRPQRLETHTRRHRPRPHRHPVRIHGNAEGGSLPLTKVDAAFLTAGGTNIWFFGNNQCYLIDALTHTPHRAFQDSNGKPVALNINATTDAQGKNWKGWNLPTDFTNGLTWAAPTLNSDGVVQDSAHLVTGTTWCPVIPSTQKSFPYITTPGDDQPVTIPSWVDNVFVELWGPGGQGGDGNAGSGDGHAGGGGGAGGAGVYLRDVLTVTATDALTVHIGSQGDYTSADLNHKTILIAPGGGGGGGSGYDSGDYGGNGGGEAGGDGGGEAGGGGGRLRNGGSGGSSTAHGGAGSTDVGGKGDGDGDSNGGGVGGSGGNGGGGGGAGIGGVGGSNGSGGNGGGVGGGGKCFGWAGGGGGGGAGDGSHGGGGGGGGAWVSGGSGGGGGAAGNPRTLDATHIGWGSGAMPEGDPPGGAATGGKGGTQHAFGSSGGTGAARITW